ncbi:FAD-binding monooxygenase [Geranomyces variabilis]|nr:FAD-binding monooxygenase [Geranomyces variabilis]KAJ3141874.1 hypothetical protein HDU90_006223 [Geranomyces variabilis]
MKVVIIGGGIGGLTTAIALSQRLPEGSQIDIYERVPDLTPIGAAISVWGNGVKVLKALGLGAQIEGYAGDMQSMAYTSSTGVPLCDFPLSPLYERVSQRACPIARTNLQKLLLDGALSSRGVKLYLNKRAMDMAQTGDNKVSVTFEDGEVVEGADLVVVADGTHSKLRDVVAGRTVARNYVGYVNFNGAVPITPTLGDPRKWTQFVGDGKRVSMMPMGEGKFYFFFDVVLPPKTASHPDRYREELAEHFAGWPQPVQELIASLNPATVARVDISDIEELETFVRGRAVLLGDSAHGTAPDLGQGGCQAMEDAWVLARCLGDHAGDVAAALKQYDTERVARTVHLVSRARKRAEMIHGKDMEATRAWYAELAAETGENIMEGMAKTILGAPAELDGIIAKLNTVTA